MHSDTEAGNEIRIIVRSNMVRFLVKLMGWGAIASLATVFGLVGNNLWLYQRMFAEQEIGSVHFSRLDNDRYQVVYLAENGESEQFELKGDQWRLDARVLKWKPWVSILGKDPLFQLERFTGRYSDPNEATKHYPTLHSVYKESVFDVWAFVRTYPELSFMVDASYGSGVYLPMQDEVGYRISVTASGLIARQLPSTSSRP